MGLVFTSKFKRIMESKTRKRESSNEEMLARAERFAVPLGNMVVRLREAKEITVQLPQELAYSLLRRRLATAVGACDVIPDIVICDEDLQSDPELEAQLWGRAVAA
jgi:hypothetical protein